MGELRCSVDLDFISWRRCSDWHWCRGCPPREAVHLVRITFANGTIAEDAVDSGIVLFEALGPITFPAGTELLDGSGVQIRSYTEFDWIG